MAIFSISDLHLSFSVDKPMDIFGNRWSDHANILKNNWESKISNNDIIIIPGDISWAISFSEVLQDLTFIHLLPGKKIILKGNHDYWWDTQSKLQKFITKHDLNTISFLHNNSYKYDNTYICGTRGWRCPDDKNFTLQDKKIYERELNRLELSIKSIKDSEIYDIIIAFHYPPFNSDKSTSEFIEIMKNYKVKKCIYGHLHNVRESELIIGMYKKIEFVFVSSDYLNFNPIKVK